MDYWNMAIRWPSAFIGFMILFQMSAVDARSMSMFSPEMSPETVVSILRTRGDAAAETNAHRIILSVHTASDFIGDVLESAIGKTLNSAISSRENLFFSLQRIGNDSRRIFELVDRATHVVCETARKAKQEINDAIRTSLDHLKESMKIIIRHLPDSKLTDTSLDLIINNGQTRMEAVVENSGQRIVDAIQSYRSHFIKIDTLTGQVMVDPVSSQEATDAVKHIIFAAKSQIQEAIAGSTSFVLARIRDSLSAPAEDISSLNVTMSTVSILENTTVSNVSVSTSNDTIPMSQMEDPSAEDKLVIVGDFPTTPKESTTQTLLSTEAPMVINTAAEVATTLETSTNASTVALTTPTLPAFQDETSTTELQITTSPVPSSTVSVIPAAPVNRRRVPQIKPISAAHF